MCLSLKGFAHPLRSASGANGDIPMERERPGRAPPRAGARACPTLLPGGPGTSARRIRPHSIHNWQHLQVSPFETAIQAAAVHFSQRRGFCNRARKGLIIPGPHAVPRPFTPHPRPARGCPRPKGKKKKQFNSFWGLGEPAGPTKPCSPGNPDSLRPPGGGARRKGRGLGTRGDPCGGPCGGVAEVSGLYADFPRGPLARPPDWNGLDHSFPAVPRHRASFPPLRPGTRLAGETEAWLAKKQVTV